MSKEKLVNPQLRSVSPFFIVRNFSESVNFYRDKLGFDVVNEVPEEEPFFGLVQRGNISIILKMIAPDVQPEPNHTRHKWARWDAYIDTENPDSLFEEFKTSGVPIHSELCDTDDGLRAFEIRDINGYVICFGCPL